MPILTWLPPLNSHEDYHIHVSAWQYHMLFDNPNLPSSQFLINFNVSVDFYSQDPSEERRFPGLSTWKTVHLLCNSINFKVGSLSRQIICNIIYNDVPFPLRRIYWEGRELDEDSSSYTLLEDDEALIESVLDFLRSMRTRSYNWRRKILPLRLEIKKSVRIPHDDFEAWRTKKFEFGFREGLSISN